MTQSIINNDQTALVVCAHCGAESADPHLCSECERVQPVPSATDYFSFLGLPRKLMIDEAELERTFYRLSRRLHPDYFMNASTAERQASIDRSSMLNDAYRTLRDPISRTQYLLSLEGYKEAEKKAPPDLLEEVFDLNMQIEELKAAKKMGDAGVVAAERRALGDALDRLNAKLKEIGQQLFALFELWDRSSEPGSDQKERKRALDRISELLSHRSYIRNLARDIKEEI
jgi:molecular chaperone HscB